MARQIQLSASEPTPVDPDPGAANRILEGLNDEQRAAVTATDGPVMIIAGPGSGKTRTLTHRIAYLLATGKARPHEIIALTFTNKAAREMKNRVQRLVGDQTRGMWVGTFHSSFARLLRREADTIGYSRDFSIYDTKDSEQIVKQQMNRLQLNTDDVRPRSVQRLISSAKNQLIDPADYADMAHGRAQETAAKVYPAYQAALKRANAMDFDDLLIKPLEVFDADADILEQYQQRWTYIHIDEYQDTNHAQYTLSKRLAAGHQNLCVVGDDAQSIYAFRGADISNILSFERDYPEATTVRLERNYRSTQNILTLADSIIDQNEDQLDKTLWTDNDAGDKIILTEALSEKDEAKKIEQKIRDLQLREGLDYGDFAVLYRTNAQSRAIEEALRRENVPYRIIGGTSFYQRKEIKDVLAYLKLMVNPHDRASIERVINYPKRGIGKKTQERVRTYATEQGLSLWQAIEQVESIDTLSTRAQNAVGSFRFLITKYQSRVDDTPVDELSRDLIQEAGVLSDLRKEHTRENLRRWENVQELVSAIAEYTESADNATLSTFLQEVALLTDLDEADDPDRVTLMTLHASKGLEFPVVFIAGLEEGLFPLAKATQERTELEEERRLFYVGATRAERWLFLSWARNRYRYGKQKHNTRSRFLEEIDDRVVRTAGGSSVKQKKKRFKSSDEGSTANYDSMDPHYYRENLRGSSKSKSRRGGTQKTKRTVRSSDNDTRRVVYDEGEGRIVPGTRVEHRTFGEGKVLSLEGTNEDPTAVVFFGGEVGNKKLKLQYARLRVVE